MMHIIGLTGGIGSGKSTASAYLNKLGYKTIDFDLMTRKLEEPGEPALDEIREAFGPESILPNGEMNRKYVGQVVFADKKEKAKLDKIMQRHLDVIITSQTDSFREQSREVNRKNCPDDFMQRSVIFYDHPLLFEVPYRIEPVEEAWVLDMDDEIRIRRIHARDGMSREDILKRMDCQMPREEKLKRADVVIDNSGTKDDLYRNLDQALSSLEKRICSESK